MEQKDQIGQFKNRLEELVKTLTNHVQGTCRKKVMSDLLSKMPAFEELPHVEDILTRKRSRGGAAANANNANQLEQILQTYIGYEFFQLT